MQSTLFSIGHGNKSIDEFLNELTTHGVDFLMDVRTKPGSKWNPQFNQNELKAELDKAKITYVFAGDQLGGLPADRTCYDSDGKVIYEVIRKKDFFKAGLERLLKANENSVNLAVMCSESKPEECHRSKLIGQELLKKGISLKHIISTDRYKSQEEVMNILTKGKNPVDLFGEEVALKSRIVH